MEKILNINASAFVIPNYASTFEAYKRVNDLSMVEYLEKIAMMNNITLEDNDKIIQCWFHSEELKSENMSDHGFSKHYDEKVFFRQNKLGFVPLKLIEDVKEGEIRLIKSYAYASKASDDSDDNEEIVELYLHTEFKQREYKYYRFGNFEDVIKMVTE